VTTHMLELLDWIAREPRGYRETMAMWGSHCPRLTPWEDAQAAGLVQVTRNGGAGLSVVLTGPGRAALSAQRH